MNALLDIAQRAGKSLETVIDRVPMDLNEVERHLDLRRGSIRRVKRTPFALKGPAAVRLADFLVQFLVEGRAPADFVDCVLFVDTKVDELRLMLRCPVCGTEFQLGGVDRGTVIHTGVRDDAGAELALVYYWGDNQVRCPASAMVTGRTLCTSEPTWWTPKPIRIHPSTEAMERAPLRRSVLAGV